MVDIISEVPLYLWVFFGICILLIVVGIILIAVRCQKQGRKSPVRGMMVDLAQNEIIGENRVVEATEVSADGFPENERKESSISELLKEKPAGTSPDMAEAVPPYTSWDNSRKSGEGENARQEASFDGFVQDYGKEISESAIEAAPRKIGEEISRSTLDASQQLLLLKSHELLLTLVDGLKKLSSAKTEAVRKEKMAEMQAALDLLDVKSEWEDYKSCFEKLYPGFWPKVEDMASEEMSPYELRLCALLSLGMGTKELADLTNRSVRTVETSIYKIRKKLGMDSDVKTQDFLRGLLQDR